MTNIEQYFEAAMNDYQYLRVTDKDDQIYSGVCLAHSAEEGMERFQIKEAYLEIIPDTILFISDIKEIDPLDIPRSDPHEMKGATAELYYLVSSAILGGAVGDALGVPVEFEDRETLLEDPVTDMRSEGSYGQPAGTWSDDTSMTLCALDSLASGLDYEDMMRKFLAWADDDFWTARGEVFDMGIATRKALVRYAHGVPPLSCGGTGINDNGNGSLMRIMPVALYLYKTLGPSFNRVPEAYEIIHNVSSLTHAHPISKMACGIYCSIACELLAGRSDNQGVNEGIQKAKEYYASLPEFTFVMQQYRRVDLDELKRMTMADVNSSGFVLSTLEAALWCLVHTNSYQSCLLKAVNLGSDTDTVAAVAGGLAGIRYGIDNIPEEWLETLARVEDIDHLCTMFSES